MLTVAEAAEKLRCSTATIRRLCKTGQIDCLNLSTTGTQDEFRILGIEVREQLPKESKLPTVQQEL
jgi:excisionase family DNA binding protein